MVSHQEEAKRGANTGTTWVNPAGVAYLSGTEGSLARRHSSQPDSVQTSTRNMLLWAQLPTNWPTCG